MVGKEDVAIRKLNEYLAACQATTLDEGLTGNALLQAIHLEKMKEFAGEGILYFDLKRLHSGSLSRLAKWGSSEDVKIESSDYQPGAVVIHLLWHKVCHPVCFLDIRCILYMCTTAELL